MGNVLSEPVRTKHNESEANKVFHFAVTAMQGWRVSMEDAHAAILNVDGNEKDAFFGVYDGHGGATVSNYISTALHEHLFEEENYKKGNYEKSLTTSFLKVDEDIRKEPSLKPLETGSTAITTLIKNNKIYCANSGDSRAVMCVGGKTVPLSYDHKPKNTEEEARIQKAGGRVEMGRVNGSLALSRAFGDFEFKTNSLLSPEEQAVTVLPEITVSDITDELEFIILACDGIWDVVSNEEAVGFVKERLDSEQPLQQICNELADRCCSISRRAGINEVGLDNISVIIVRYLNEKLEAIPPKIKAHAVDDNESIV